ncbi:MAG: hypothetical protein ACXVCY_07860 [Pseudobdellovibrionaceae bacterium]
MNFKYCLVAFLITLKTSAFAAIGGLENKILSFRGQSSEHGSYTGLLELRKNGDSLQVTRIMTYDSFKFENLTVQEVWTGTAKYDSKSNAYSISYTLKKADFISAAEGQTRKPEDFKIKDFIFQKIVLAGNSLDESHFFRHNEFLSESLQINSSAGQEPLWQDKRYHTESISHESSTLYKIAAKFLEMKVFNWYHDQEVPKSYSYRPEYKTKKQLMVYDPTDFEFYRSNPNILRVVNKTPDTISLIEDIQKRNAYAPTLHEKAMAFEIDMANYNLNEYGIYSAALYSQDGHFQKFIMDGDAALWTGMYLSSQAMRYAVSHEQAALENIKKSLQGLMLLMDITGDPKEFARTIVKYENGMQLSSQLIRGTGVNSDKVWLSKGNNDMYKGLVHGFIAAYLVLPPSESALKNALLEHMKRVPDLNAADSRSNAPSAYGLRALATQNSDDRDAYESKFFKKNAVETVLNVEGDIHVGGIADWSGVNLSMVGGVSEILIAQALNEKDILNSARKDLLLSWKDMAGTKRDFLTIAAYGFAVKNGVKPVDVIENNDGYSNQELQNVWNQDLKLSLWSIKEIPIHRSQYSISWDHSLNPEWCLSWWPRLPWKSITDRKPPEFHFQGVESYPYFEAHGLGSDFAWKDAAFAYKGETSKFTRFTGADYLYSYWMARYVGLISGND